MPGGRPTSITKVVHHRERRDPDTQQVVERIPVTAGERIVELIRAGNYVETAAAAANVSKESVYAWLRTAADAHGKQHRGDRLTAQDRRCMAFSDAVDEAQAASEAEDVARLQQLGRGRTVTTTTTKYDANGNVLETTSSTKELGPDPDVLTWRLERRFRARWGRQLQLDGELDVHADRDPEQAREVLGDLVAEVAERMGAVRIVGAGAEADLQAVEERPEGPLVDPPN
jgi:hypothetical protein